MSTSQLMGAGAALAFVFTASAASAQLVSPQGATSQTAPPAATAQPAPQAATDAALPDLSAYGVPPQIMQRGSDDPVAKRFGIPEFMSSYTAINQLRAYYKRLGSSDADAYTQAVEAVQVTALDNQESCSTLIGINNEQKSIDAEQSKLDAEQVKEPKKHKIWGIFRAILGVAQVGVAYALDPKQLLYAGEVALGQVQSAGDRIEYERVMKLYNRRMMLYARMTKLYSQRGSLWDKMAGNWCYTMAHYDVRYGANLGISTPSTPQNTANSPPVSYAPTNRRRVDQQPTTTVGE